MMEKYYIIGSLVLSGACVASACAAGRLGLDTKNHVCWYNNENEAEMLRWVIGTQVVWLLLLSVAELGVFIIILLHLLPFISDCNSKIDRSSMDSESQTRSSTQLTIVMLRGIILRIGIYPLISCLMNITSSALSLYPLEEQEEAVPSGPPALLGLVIYAARPLVYSIIAATDPSFIRALQARHTTASGSLSAAQRTTQVPPSVCLTTFVDLTSESTHGGESNHLGIGIGIQTQLENSFNQTESTLGVSLMAEKADDVGDEIHGVGVAKPVAALSSAAQWDIARHI